MTVLQDRVARRKLEEEKEKEHIAVEEDATLIRLQVHVALGV